MMKAAETVRVVIYEYVKGRRQVGSPCSGGGGGGGGGGRDGCMLMLATGGEGRVHWEAPVEGL